MTNTNEAKSESKKRTRVMSAKYDRKNGAVTLEFKSDGSTIVIHPSDIAEALHSTMVLRAAVAVVQGAIHNAENGESPNALAQGALASLRDGTWTPREKADKEEEQNEIVLALVEVTGKNYDAVMAEWAKRNKREKGVIRNHPKVAAILARRAAERAKEAARAAKAQDVPPLDF